MIKKYEIKSSHFLVNGAPCKNFVIDWEEPDCINVTCKPDENGNIKFEIPDGCDEKCVYGVVRCLDDNCTNCPTSERIMVCPCVDNADCEDCEDCLKGVCVKRCEIDEYCNNDACVECDPEHPCSNGEICVEGECVCPPKKPFKNKKGVCVNCKDNDDCPPCSVCTPEGCKEIDCVVGSCDITTGKCEECVITGDCKGPNECCVDNKCNCCAGFIRNLSTGTCEPDDLCKTDKECGVCEICTDTGCQPKICPDGFTCVNDECVRLCDCNQVYCSKYETCIDLDSKSCFCKECEGNCSTHEDCGPGCYCDGEKCVPSPCKGKCTTGADCGPGCGCDGEKCVPCDSLSCMTGGTCEEILGCECTGLGCQDATGCTGECSSHHDCGEGCTCYKGSCTSCKDFPCEGDSCTDQPGCGCDENSQCEGNGGGSDCKDSLIVEKDNSTCRIEGDLIKKEPCTCGKITFTTTVKKIISDSNQYYMDLDVELRKGGGLSLSQSKLLHLLGDNSKDDIAENEIPKNGTIAIRVQTFYDEYNSNGQRIGINVPGLIDEDLISYSNSSVTDTVSFKNLKIKHVGFVESQTMKVSKVEITILQLTTLKFPNNCEYKPIVNIDKITLDSVTESVFDDIVNGDNLQKLKLEDFKVITSDSIRHPLFKWYRSDDGIYADSNIFRKLYIPEDSVTKYVDELKGPKDAPNGKYPLMVDEGGLRSGKHYMLKADCSCAEPYDLGRLIFCNPSALYFDTSECGTKVTIKEPFKPCKVNQLLTKFGVNDLNSQVEYDLYLNDTNVATFIDSPTGMIIKGTPVSMFSDFTLGGDNITKVELKINHDVDGECDLVYELPNLDEIDVNYSMNCSTAISEFYDVTIPIVQSLTSGGTVSIEDIWFLESGNSYILDKNATTWFLKIEKSKQVKIELTFSNKCKKTLDFFENCCDDFKVELNGNDVSCGGNLVLDVDIIGGQAPFNFNYYKGSVDPNALPQPLPAPYSTDHVTIPEGDYENGIITVNVIDANGCVASDGFQVNVGELEFNYPETMETCDGNNVVLTFTGTTGAKVTTDIPGHLELTLPETVNIVVNSDTTFNYTMLKHGSCQRALVDAKTVVDTDALPSATFTNPNAGSNTCSTDSPTVNVNGTPNAVVKFSVNGAIDNLVLDSSGNGYIAVPNTEGNHTVKKLEVKLNTCVNSDQSTTMVGVLTTPTIVIDNETYECNGALDKYSVEFTSSHSALSASHGTVSNIAGDVYVLENVPVGVSSTITSINGNCSRNETTVAHICDCTTQTVTPPTNDGDESYCSEDVIPEISVTSTFTVNWYSEEHGGTLLETDSLTYTPGSITGDEESFWAEAVNSNGCTSDRTEVIITKKYAVDDVDVYTITNVCENTIHKFYSNVVQGNATDPLTYNWSTDLGTIVGTEDDDETVLIDIPDVTGVDYMNVTLEVVSGQGCSKSYTLENEEVSDSPAVVDIPISTMSSVHDYGLNGTYFNSVDLVKNEAWGKIDNPGYDNDNNRLNLVSREPNADSFNFIGSYTVGPDGVGAVGFGVDNYAKLYVSVNGGPKDLLISLTSADGNGQFGHSFWHVVDFSAPSGAELCFSIEDGVNSGSYMAIGLEVYSEDSSVLKTYTTKAEVDAVVVEDTGIFVGKSCADGSNPEINNCGATCPCS